MFYDAIATAVSALWGISTADKFVLITGHICFYVYIRCVERDTHIGEKIYISQRAREHTVTMSQGKIQAASSLHVQTKGESLNPGKHDHGQNSRPTRFEFRLEQPNDATLFVHVREGFEAPFTTRLSVRDCRAGAGKSQDPERDSSKTPLHSST